MSRFSKATKYISYLLAVTLFITNCLWAHKPEEQFWTERRKGIHQASKPESTLLARLPMGMGPGNALPAAVLNRTAQGAELLPFETTKKWKQANLKRDWVRLLQTVPSQFATVRRICTPKKSNSNRIILHLQDVHLNDEAQSNLARVVANVASHGAINLIGLEGAFEETSLELFQNFPYPEASKKAAEYLFKSQRISGPVLAALTTPKWDARVVGIDDRAAYAANVEAFKEGALLRPKLLEAISDFSTSIDKRVDAFHNESLKKIYRSRHDYWDEKITLASYLQELSDGADDIFPQVELFLTAFDIEKSIDFQKVENERRAFLEYAPKKFSTRDMEELGQLGLAFKSGDVSQAAFYEHFSRLVERAQLNLKSFPVFKKYIQYVLMADGIDPEKLFEDVRSLEAHQLDKENFSDSERAVLEADRWLHLSSKLADFSLTKDEWEEYEALKARVQEMSNLSASLVQPFEMFYRQAHLRDDLMAENFLTQMDQKRSIAAMLVTGGFHASGMEKSLLKAGVTVVHITPRLTKIDGESGLAALSVFSQEKTPLEKLASGQKLFLAPAPMALEESALAYSGQAGLLGGPNAFQRSLAWFSKGLHLPKFISVKRTSEGLVALVNASGQRVRLFFKNEDGSTRLSGIVVGLAFGSAVLGALALFLKPNVFHSSLAFPFVITVALIAGIFMVRRFLLTRPVSKSESRMKNAGLSRRGFLKWTVGAGALAAVGMTSGRSYGQEAEKPNDPNGNILDYRNLIITSAARERRTIESWRQSDVDSNPDNPIGVDRETWTRIRAINPSSPLDSAVQELLTATDPYYRASLAKAFGLKGNPVVIDALLQASNDPNRIVRMYVAWALGRFHATSGQTARAFRDRRLETLTRLLADDDFHVRAQAIRSLGSLRTDPRAIDAIRGVLKNKNEHLYVTLAAVEACETLLDPNLFKDLFALLEEHIPAEPGLFQKLFNLSNVPTAYQVDLRAAALVRATFPIFTLWERIPEALYAIRMRHPDHPEVTSALRERETRFRNSRTPYESGYFQSVIEPLIKGRRPYQKNWAGALATAMVVAWSTNLVFKGLQDKMGGHSHGFETLLPDAHSHHGLSHAHGAAESNPRPLASAGARIRFLLGALFHPIHSVIQKNIVTLFVLMLVLTGVWAMVEWNLSYGSLFLEGDAVHMGLHVVAGIVLGFIYFMNWRWYGTSKPKEPKQQFWNLVGVITLGSTLMIIGLVMVGMEGVPKLLFPYPTTANSQILLVTLIGFFINAMSILVSRGLPNDNPVFTYFKMHQWADLIDSVEILVDFVFQTQFNLPLVDAFLLLFFGWHFLKEGKHGIWVGFKALKKLEDLEKKSDTAHGPPSRPLGSLPVLNPSVPLHHHDHDHDHDHDHAHDHDHSHDDGHDHHHHDHPKLFSKKTFLFVIVAAVLLTFQINFIRERDRHVGQTPAPAAAVVKDVDPQIKFDPQVKTLPAIPSTLAAYKANATLEHLQNLNREFSTKLDDLRAEESVVDSRQAELRTNLGKAKTQISVLQAKIKEHEATVDTSRSAADQVEPQVEAARSRHERIRRLMSSGGITQAEFEKTKADYLSLSKQKKGHEDAILSAQRNISAVQAVIDQIRKEVLPAIEGNIEKEEAGRKRIEIARRRLFMEFGNGKQGDQDGARFGFRLSLYFYVADHYPRDAYLFLIDALQDAEKRYKGKDLWTQDADGTALRRFQDEMAVLIQTLHQCVQKQSAEGVSTPVLFQPLRNLWEQRRASGQAYLTDPYLERALLQIFGFTPPVLFQPVPDQRRENKGAMLIIPGHNPGLQDQKVAAVAGSPSVMGMAFLLGLFGLRRSRKSKPAEKGRKARANDRRANLSIETLEGRTVLDGSLAPFHPGVVIDHDSNVPAIVEVYRPDNLVDILPASVVLSQGELRASPTLNANDFRFENKGDQILMEVSPKALTMFLNRLVENGIINQLQSERVSFEFYVEVNNGSRQLVGVLSLSALIEQNGRVAFHHPGKDIEAFNVAIKIDGEQTVPDIRVPVASISPDVPDHIDGMFLDGHLHGIGVSDSTESNGYDNIAGHDDGHEVTDGISGPALFDEEDHGRISNGTGSSSQKDGAVVVPEEEEESPLPKLPFLPSSQQAESIDEFMERLGAGLEDPLDFSPLARDGAPVITVAPPMGETDHPQLPDQPNGTDGTPPIGPGESPPSAVHPDQQQSHPDVTASPSLAVSLFSWAFVSLPSIFGFALIRMTKARAKILSWQDKSIIRIFWIGSILMTIGLIPILLGWIPAAFVLPVIMISVVMLIIFTAWRNFPKETMDEPVKKSLAVETEPGPGAFGFWKWLEIKGWDRDRSHALALAGAMESIGSSSLAILLAGLLWPTVSALSQPTLPIDFVFPFLAMSAIIFISIFATVLLGHFITGVMNRDLTVKSGDRFNWKKSWQASLTATRALAFSVPMIVLGLWLAPLPAAALVGAAVLIAVQDHAKSNRDSARKPAPALHSHDEPEQIAPENYQYLPWALALMAAYSAVVIGYDIYHDGSKALVADLWHKVADNVIYLITWIAWKSGSGTSKKYRGYSAVELGSSIISSAVLIFSSFSILSGISGHDHHADGYGDPTHVHGGEIMLIMLMGIVARAWSLSLLHSGTMPRDIKIYAQEFYTHTGADMWLHALPFLAGTAMVMGMKNWGYQEIDVLIATMIGLYLGYRAIRLSVRTIGLLVKTIGRRQSGPPSAPKEEAVAGSVKRWIHGLMLFASVLGQSATRADAMAPSPVNPIVVSGNNSSPLLDAFPPARPLRIADLTQSLVIEEAEQPHKKHINVFEIRSVQDIRRADDFMRGISAHAVSKRCNGVIFVIVDNDPKLKTLCRKFSQRRLIPFHLVDRGSINANGNRINLGSVLAEAIGKREWQIQFQSSLQARELEIRLFAISSRWESSVQVFVPASREMIDVTSLPVRVFMANLINETLLDMGTPADMNKLFDEIRANQLAARST
ncbi:MAG: hypothetical protein KCHDKBKB_02541 [Elusimicrobia bacterium]|nr:hypothetical protein [Elusimicrobiota bacterium]